MDECRHQNNVAYVMRVYVIYFHMHFNLIQSNINVGYCNVVQCKLGGDGNL